MNLYITKTGRPRTRLFPPEKIALIRQMYTDGCSMRELARLFGVSSHTISKYVNEPFDKM
jgi:transposase-like protein